jgi:uncharacterized membrane protein YbhN (UPF0104 family)
LDRLKRHAHQLVAVGLGLVGLWIVVRGSTLHELVGVLAQANGVFIVAACFPLLAVGSVLRAGRYRALLPVGRTQFSDIWSAVVVGGAANNVLPLRAGDLLRTRETVATGVPLRRVISAVLAEKGVETTTLVIWASPAVATYAGLRHPLPTVGLALAVGSVGIAWLARRYGEIEVPRIASSAAWSFVADGVEIAVISACLAGLGAPAGLLRSVTVFAAVNLAIAMPATPGNIGAFEAGAALPLIATGVDRDTAVAFAVLYRAVQWLPVTLLGTALFAFRPRVGAS